MFPKEHIRHYLSTTNNNGTNDISKGPFLCLGENPKKSPVLLKRSISVSCVGGSRSSSLKQHSFCLQQTMMIRLMNPKTPMTMRVGWATGEADAGMLSAAASRGTLWVCSLVGSLIHLGFLSSALVLIGYRTTRPSGQLVQEDNLSKRATSPLG